MNGRVYTFLFLFSALTKTLYAELPVHVIVSRYRRDAIRSRMKLEIAIIINFLTRHQPAKFESRSRVKQIWQAGEGSEEAKKLRIRLSQTKTNQLQKDARAISGEQKSAGKE